MRKRALVALESSIIIPLEIVVQRHIFIKHYLEWKDSSARLLYVILKSPDAGYRYGRKEEKDDVKLY